MLYSSPCMPQIRYNVAPHSFANMLKNAKDVWCAVFGAQDPAHPRRGMVYCAQFTNIASLSVPKRGAVCCRMWCCLLCIAGCDVVCCLLQDAVLSVVCCRTWRCLLFVAGCGVVCCLLQDVALPVV